ncbi:hypothetical protein Q8F55_003364 [Vanrija albida]|uniref:Uncharacterized protein n=1 Tax=Vanrija albida TaxID=181172 RepID=A0ABR3Q4K3_9TREE
MTTRHSNASIASRAPTEARSITDWLQDRQSLREWLKQQHIVKHLFRKWDEMRYRRKVFSDPAFGAREFEHVWRQLLTDSKAVRTDPIIAADHQVSLVLGLVDAWEHAHYEFNDKNMSRLMRLYNEFVDSVQSFTLDGGGGARLMARDIRLVYDLAPDAPIVSAGGAAERRVMTALYRKRHDAVTKALATAYAYRKREELTLEPHIPDFLGVGHLLELVSVVESADIEGVLDPVALFPPGCFFPNHYYVRANLHSWIDNKHDVGYTGLLELAGWRDTLERPEIGRRVSLSAGGGSVRSFSG